MFRHDGVTVPSHVVERRDRRPGAEVLPQGRACRRSTPDGRAAARRDGQARARAARRTRAQVFHRLAGCWRHWGEKHGYFDTDRGRAGVLRRALPHARRPARRAQQPAVVQHRPPLGLRHQRSRPGSLLRRPEDRRAEAGELAYTRPQPHACFIQTRRRRPRQRRRHHGPLGPRGAALQVRLAARARTSPALRGENEPLSGGGQVLGPDVASSRSATAPRARSSPAARRVAPRRWSASTSITPTSRTFVDWKVIEEQKVAALVGGQQESSTADAQRVMQACYEHPDATDTRFDRAEEFAARRGDRRRSPHARADELRLRVIALAEQGPSKTAAPLECRRYGERRSVRCHVSHRR